MNEDPYARRRRAGLSALGEYLQEGLIDALWEIDEGLRSDTVADVIRVVDRIARLQGVHPQDTKLLYAKLFAALKKGGDDLPPDPWPLMVAARPERVRASKRTAISVALPLPSPPPPPTSGSGQMWEFVDIV